ncbi:acetolactate synthase large subunit [Primorskyibacter sp. S87]|uniref:acetolactate synthase large subunit n=1 Tax=Primorskyibacter sp. S87 TaxID=3415126 RepID=UPI003C7E0A3A
MNGAESLVHSLLRNDVDLCFTNPGTSEMHFVAALDTIPGMRSVLALHEGTATGAADGYWRLARRPACTLLHLGPGLANGLSNLHNARKAGSGVVNIVGEHATSHLELDAPLASDIEGIARPVSHWVETSGHPAMVGSDAARAVQAARTEPGQIATLILPGDTAWPAGGQVAGKLEPPAPVVAEEHLVDQAANLLRSEDSLLLLGGEALTERNLRRAGEIAASTGCALLSEWSNARTERGAGRVWVGRVPYPIDIAIETLSRFRRIVLLGARAPIGFFAYPDKPAKLTRPDCEILTLADPAADLAGTLETLHSALCSGTKQTARLAERRFAGIPVGALTPESIGDVLCHSIPENAIVVDESITSGRVFGTATAGAAPHTWLNNCGGSIGYSLPAAVGAALACPDRKILTLTGDGSGMYNPQAIWTMAREGLDVTMLIFANRSYEILRGELTNVGVANPGPRAIDMLSLDRPALDWVALARSMGAEACRVESNVALVRALEAGFSTKGPVLIEAVL